MAKKSELDTKRAQLAGLIAEREKLLARIPELEREREAVGVEDAGRAVAQLKDISHELDASRRVLGSLEARISQLRAEVDEAQSAEDRAAVAALWPKEQKAMARVVDLTSELRAELETLEAIRRGIADHRGMCKSKPFDLLKALRGLEASWDLWGWWHSAAPGEPGGRRPSLPDPEPKFVLKRAKRRGQPARLYDHDGFPMVLEPND